MNRNELKEILKNGENSGVEFKLDRVTPKDLAREMVAFANFQGGMILLGVDDHGQIQGLTRERIEEWVMSICRDKVRAEIIPYFEIIRDVEPGKDIAIIRVGRGWNVITCGITITEAIISVLVRKAVKRHRKNWSDYSNKEVSSG